MLPGVLPVVDEHQAYMQRLELRTVALVVRAWQRVDLDDIVGSWEGAIAGLLRRVAEAQQQAATAGSRYAGAALRTQGVNAPSEARVNPSAFTGWASDGRPLESLLRAPLDVVAEGLDEGRSLEDSMKAGKASARRIAHTQVGDAGRVAAGVDIATRPHAGWVRMLSGKSCSRCILLAGQFFRWNEGFERHPQDDCVHVPTSTDQGRARELLSDPKTFFESLTREEQDAEFTKSGAQAIRDGADIGQVVNARRGMSTAADSGLKITSEGTTRRGFAGSRAIRQGARVVTVKAETVRRISRDGVVTRVVERDRVQTHRLMPESIYKIATSREQALALLKQYGFIV